VKEPPVPCSRCAATATAERLRRTALGYRTFHCPACRRIFNERTGTPYNHLQYPTDIVLLVVLWRLRYTLRLRDLAEMFLERGFVFSHEAVRDWEARCAPLHAALPAPLGASPRGCSVVAVAAQWGQGTGSSFTQHCMPRRYQIAADHVRPSSEF